MTLLGSTAQADGGEGGAGPCRYEAMHRGGLCRGLRRFPHRQTLQGAQVSFPTRARPCPLQESEQDSEPIIAEEGRKHLIQPHSGTKDGPFITTWPLELRGEAGSKERERVGASSRSGLGGKERWGTLAQGGSPLSTYPHVAGPLKDQPVSKQQGCPFIFAVRVLAVKNYRNPLQPASRQEGIIS